VTCAGQAQLEERVDKQQKIVTSIVEQQTRNLEEDIKARRRELEVQLARWKVESDVRVAVVQEPTPLQ
jgi:hypothetical protein